MTGVFDGSSVVSAPATGERFDLKAMRLATHGWRSGNPLIYKPGAADLSAVARELASAGLPSGAMLLDDTRGIARVRLILRAPALRSQLGMAAACAFIELAEDALCRRCAVWWPWDVVLRDGGAPHARLCRVSVERQGDVALLGLRIDFERFRVAAGGGAQPSGSIFARREWREVALARTLHAFDARLNTLEGMGGAPAPEAARVALQREWMAQLVAPMRGVVVCHDDRRYESVATRIAPDGALLVRRADGERCVIPLDEASASCGSRRAVVSLGSS